MKEFNPYETIQKEKDEAKSVERQITPKSKYEDEIEMPNFDLLNAIVPECEKRQVLIDIASHVQ